MLKRSDPLRDPLTRFFSYVQKSDTCWNWTGGKDPDGYGIFKTGGKSYRVHRFIYSEMVGTIPPRAIVMHSCNNPGCVNPEHLFIGDTQTNMIHAAMLGRLPHMKLTSADVQEIRRLVRTSSLPNKEIAQLFGIDKSHVSLITTKRIYAWVPDVEG